MINYASDNASSISGFNINLSKLSKKEKREKKSATLEIQPMKFGLVYEPAMIVLEYIEQNAFSTMYHKMPVEDALSPSCTAESVLEYLENNNERYL